MQKHVNLVDLVKSFPTNIYLQKLASIQKRTSPVKFDHLAEKSATCSISNLSIKAWAAEEAGALAALLVEARVGDPDGIALAGYGGPVGDRASVSEFLMAKW